ncbi:hypothetical protein C2G38_2192528 [Gigaspora rosea]|uniref:Uncharacterized protein n=1 Tax=Gigaspora rosea TaxID=44941 RepID=A0A397V7U4_9GLOM|nr:hypothetical protein C2G38_2192528 [Gigaspora rosea]
MSRRAVYRTGIDELVEYKFKAFRFSETTLVEEVFKNKSKSLYRLINQVLQLIIL